MQTQLQDVESSSLTRIRPGSLSLGAQNLSHQGSLLPSSKNFIVSSYTFRSLIHFKFIFLYDVRECSSFILLYGADQFSQNHFLKRMSFLHYIFLTLLSYIRWPQVHGFISRLSILFHSSVFIFLCQYHIVLITVALYYSSKSGSINPPLLFFFLKIVGFSGTFVFPYKL